MSTDRLAAAELLERIAGYLEFREENPFRIRAFRTAAGVVRSLAVPVADALADGTLAATRGIGQTTLAIIREHATSGRSALLDELTRALPPGLPELLDVPGLGPTRVRAVHRGLGVGSLAELEAAARDGRLAALPGFGPKTIEKLLKGIAFARGTRAFRLYPDARRDAELVREALGAVPGLVRLEVAGEVRRGLELVGSLTLAAAGDSPAAVLAAAVAGLAGVEVEAAGEFRLRLRAPGAGVVTLELGPPERFGATLLRATGSPAHLAALTARAQALGLRLDDSGLWRDGEVLATAEEAACYAALGLPVIPPELREDGEEVAGAAAGRLPHLVQREDLRGLLHCHTVYSDGTLSVAELAAAARDAGYDYLGISDHSRSAAYAGGLSEEAVRRQWDEIDALNARGPGIRVLKGIEADLLTDGSLDYDDALLRGFDFVIGSVHSRLGLEREAMTARILAALEHPCLTILGHPTGRQLLARNPYPLALEEVFARAAANRVALEINGDPHRLDLDWRLVRQAKAAGVVFAIGADAHSRDDLRYQAYGLQMARKAGLEPADLLNTLAAEDVLRFAAARRG